MPYLWAILQTQTARTFVTLTLFPLRYLKPEAGSFEFHTGIEMDGAIMKNNFIVTTKPNEKFQFFANANFTFTVSFANMLA